MSDIPLHKIQSNRNLEQSGIALSPETMPAAVVTQAVISSRRKRDYKSGKRKDRYVDDFEEEQGLLGSPSLEDGDDYDGRTPVRIGIFHSFDGMVVNSAPDYTRTNPKEPRF
jgi:hypothetical protein